MFTQSRSNILTICCVLRGHISYPRDRLQRGLTQMLMRNMNQCCSPARILPWQDIMTSSSSAKCTTYCTFNSDLHSFVVWWWIGNVLLDHSGNSYSWCIRQTRLEGTSQSKWISADVSRKVSRDDMGGLRKSRQGRPLEKWTVLWIRWFSHAKKNRPIEKNVACPHQKNNHIGRQWKQLIMTYTCVFC